MTPKLKKFKDLLISFLDGTIDVETYIRYFDLYFKDNSWKPLKKEFVLIEKIWWYNEAFESNERIRKKAKGLLDEKQLKMNLFRYPQKIQKLIDIENKK